MEKLNWDKKGKIFDPTNQNEWMNNYSQNPNVLVLEDRLRIYFTTRPARDVSGKMVSRTSFADFEKEEPFKLIEVSSKPIMELGSCGEFDEFGIMPGSIVSVNENKEVWMYYVGWTRMQSVPYRWTNGLAISKDNGKTFTKLSNGPIMGVDSLDPYLLACPRVKRFSKNDWWMWYESGLGWNDVGDYKESIYQTKLARSADGIHWNKDGEIVFDTSVPHECQTSPSYFFHNGLHHMLFSYRHGIDFRNKNNGYRIGYAYSDNKIDWVRDDKLVGIDVSKEGWDSEMICYPDIVEISGEIYLFYCGNYFGEKGFGYAKLLK